jgi:hypothetical protein
MKGALAETLGLFLGGEEHQFMAPGA